MFGLVEIELRLPPAGMTGSCPPPSKFPGPTPNACGAKIQGKSSSGGAAAADQQSRQQVVAADTVAAAVHLRSDGSSSAGTWGGAPPASWSKLENSWEVILTASEASLPVGDDAIKIGPSNTVHGNLSVNLAMHNQRWGAMLRDGSTGKCVQARNSLLS